MFLEEDEPPLPLAVTEPLVVLLLRGVGGVWVILGGGAGAWTEELCEEGAAVVVGGGRGSLRMRRLREETRLICAETIEGIGGKIGGPPDDAPAVDGRFVWLESGRGVLPSAS